MNLMFNELSLKPSSNSKPHAIEKAKQFALTFSAARKKGFKKIWSDLHPYQIKLSQDYSIKDFLCDKSLPKKDFKDLKDILFGTITQPDLAEKVEKEYIYSNTYYKINNSREKCFGLSVAHLCNKLAISLNSSNEWQNNQLNIKVENDKASILHKVYNVFSENCFSVPIIEQYIESITDLKLIKSDIEPVKKIVKLRGTHHGKLALKALANKLVNSPYVIEIESTNFGGNRFIRKIHPDGFIEIVDMKSDERFALRVKTTGINYKQTESIAKELEKRYS